MIIMFFGDRMLDIINKLIWEFTTLYIIVCSFRLSKVLHYPQLKLRRIFSFLCNNKNKNTFSILMVTLGGKIGVGSIAGIALAIYMGGIGTIFWIWIITIISAILVYAETILSINYKENNESGGPSFYIKKGLNFNLLAKIYAVVMIICYIGGFLSIQTNTIAILTSQYLFIDYKIIGIIITLISFSIINGGLSSITRVSNKLVPLMTLLYIFLGLIVLFNNISLLPKILINTLESALNLKSFFASLIPTIIIGIQRGIFSTESGLGTSGIVASSMKVKDSIGQAYIQIFGSYITGILISTITFIIIACSDYMNLKLNNLNGIEIVKYAFNFHFGFLGEILLYLFIIMFSFSTIFTGYYYGEANLKFITDNKYSIIILKVITLICLFLGSITLSNLLWKLVDIFVALLMIINIYCIMLLKKHIDT